VKELTFSDYSLSFML